MKNIILVFSLLLCASLSAQDTLIRTFNATVTFNGFSQTGSGRFSGTLSVNDQTGLYSADSVLVGDYVYAQNTALYIVDTVSSKNFVSANVVIRRLSGPTGIPFGKGDISRPTKNYKLYTFTPDNDNGISTQAQFVKLSGVIVRIDSLAQVLKTSIDSVQGNTTLDGLTDVSAAAPSHNDIIRYDTSLGYWLADSIPAKAKGIYYASSGQDLTLAVTDSIINLAEIHSFYLNIQSPASSNLIMNLNYPGDDDLGKILVIFAEDDDGTYGIQLGSNIFVGYVQELTYNMFNGQTLILSAQKTSLGNRWVAIENNVVKGIGGLDASRLVGSVGSTNQLDTVRVGGGLSLSGGVLSVNSNSFVNSGTLTSGAVTMAYSLFGSGTPTITKLTAGSFKITMPANTNIRSITVFANNTELSLSNEFIFTFDNSANSSDYWLSTQLYDVGTGAFIDQHATSTNHTQTVSSNISTLVFPGMNLFGSTGFRIIVR